MVGFKVLLASRSIILEIDLIHIPKKDPSFLQKAFKIQMILIKYS